MKVALAQLDPAADLERDRDTACSVIDSVAGSDLVLFPELFLGGYNTTDPAAVATAADGPELRAIGQACGESGTAAIVGFSERTGDGSYANSAACFDQAGRLVSVYRKTHLFGEAERASFTAGDDLLPVRLAGQLVGPQICFDVEFPEPSRLMARAGTDLLATISANMAPYASDHRLSARARALENRCHHLYVNRVGSEAGYDFVGESCVIGPDGSVLAELGGEEGVLEHEIDVVISAPETAYLDQLRPDLNVIVHDNANGGEA